MAYLTVKKFSTTAGSNTNATTGINWDEGMAPSAVNDSARSTLAAIAEFYQALPLDCNFRLTLTSGTAVTTSDVTAATTVYVTPYLGNRIWLYDGSAQWNLFTSSEMSIAVPATTATMYDVFCYDNSGTPTLELTAWTNDTTRATALTLQNGVYVKSGATTRRYLGSFRTTGVSGQTEDSQANRLVFNMYNRVPRTLKKFETTASWSYSSLAWRSSNNSTSNRVATVTGVAEVVVDLVNTQLVSTGGSVYVGIGQNTTTANSGDIIAVFENSARTSASAFIKTFPAVGYNYFQAVEYGGTTGTFHGAYGQSSQHGLHGTVTM